MLCAIFCALLISARSKQCTNRRTLFDVTNNNYKSYFGKSRPVFVRYYTKGCHYVHSSEPYWREAADLFPSVLFLQAECTSTAINACRDQSINLSPSHALFGINSDTPLAKFQNPRTISQSSQYFADLIAQHLSIYSLDSATVEDLLPQTTNKFFESYKYPVFLLYDSRCVEDADFMTKIMFDINNYNVSFSDTGFGKIDCSKYPDECIKWGSTYPAANIFSRKNAISVSITENDDIGTRIQAAISFLEKETTAYPTPAPYRTPKVTPTPEDTSYKKITVPELESRDINEFRTKYYNSVTRSYTGSDCTNSPVATKCTEPELRPEAYTDFVRLLNFYRELAGVPHDVKNDISLNYGCMQAALLCSRQNKISHYISDFSNKRTDCSFNPIWDVIGQRLDQSNLAQGDIPMTEMLSGLIDDPGETNAAEVGHRRWFLYPHLKTVGIGFYPVSETTIDWGGRPMKTENRQTGVFSVAHDQTNKEDYTGINFVAWPAAGPFPVQRLPTSWSVQYNKLKDKKITLNDISIKITRDDGKTFEVTNKYIDQNGGCLSGTLIFIVSDESLKLCTAGHKVHVEVFISESSTMEVLDYNIEFFDDRKEDFACFYAKDKAKCPIYVEDSSRFGPGEYSNFVAQKDSQRTNLYIVEDITLTNSLRLDYSPSILVQGYKIIGDVIIGSKSEADFADTSNTNVIIEVDPTNLECGVLRTTIKAKSLSIKLTRNPSYSGRLRKLLYAGPSVTFDCPKNLEVGDYTYFFSVVYSGTEAYLVKQSVSKVNYLCQGGNRYNLNVPCQSFTNFYEIKNFKTFKQIQKVYASDPIDVSANAFPYVKGQTYYIYSKSSLTIEYSPTLENKAELIIHQPMSSSEKLSPTFRHSYHFPSPLINQEILPKVYPFKNVRLDKVDTNGNPEKYQIPDLVGDDNSKDIYSYTEPEVYDESITPFTEMNGIYEYTKESNEILTPLFITNGLYNQYQFSTTNEKVRIRIKPTEGSRSKKITLSFPLKPTNFLSIFILDYDDVTIRAQKSQTLNLYTLIRFINVSKVTFIDLDDDKNQVQGISTDVIGNKDIDLSSSTLDSITYENLYFRTDNNIYSENIICNNAHVYDSKPTIIDLEILNLEVIQGLPVLKNCKVNGIVTLSVKDESFPVVYLNKCEFNPSTIIIKLPNPTSSNLKKILSSENDLSLFLVGLDSTTTESISSKVQIVDNDGNNLNYKAIPSKDKTGLYIVEKDFDENNAPDSVGSKADAQDFVLNSPPPVVSDEYEEPEKPVETSDSSNSINQESYSINQTDDLDQNSANEKKKGLSKGALIGIIVAAVVVVVIVVVVIVIFLVRRRRYKNSTGGEIKIDKNGKATNGDNNENYDADVYDFNNSDGL